MNQHSTSVVGSDRSARSVPPPELGGWPPGREARRPLPEHVPPDGSGLLVRPLEPSDTDLVLEVFDGLGATSRAQRFLAPKQVLTAADLRVLTAVDHHDHEALVALAEPGRRPVGVARFVRVPGDPATADVAVVVVDEWQNRGVGITLATALVARARELGVGTFSIMMAHDNEAALRLMHRVLHDVTRVAVERGTAEFLGPVPAPTHVRKGA